MQNAHNMPTATRPFASSAARQAAAGAAVALTMLLPVTGLAGSGDIAWQPAVEIASGEAHMGPWRMNESDFRYVDDPSVALDEEGLAAVVWVDQASQEVLFQRFDRDGKPQGDEPTNVSRSGDTFSWLPRVVIAADDPDTLYVLWQEIIFSGGSHGGEILFARSGDGGETFSAPLNLSNTRHGAGKGRLTAQRWDNGSLDLAEGPDGTIWAAWTAYEGELQVSRSVDGGRSFSEPQQLAGDDSRPARAPSLAVDGDGRVHLAWTLGEDPAADIHYAVSDRRGDTFEAPRAVNETEGHADAPALAVDDSGVVHLVYAESPDGLWQPAQIHYTRADPDHDFLAPQMLSVEQAEGFDSLGFASLAVTGNAVYVIWELFPRLGHRSQGLGITHSSDGGESFAPATIVPHSGRAEPGFNGSLQGLLTRKLAVNGAGEIAVVNSTFQPDVASRVRLIRGRHAP
jgi:hypothetical protein